MEEARVPGSGADPSRSDPRAASGPPGVRFTAETRDLHARLSAASCRFLDYVERTPACLDRREFAALGPGDELYGHVLQPWPTFVDRQRVAVMTAASVGLSGLIKSLGQRLFLGDPARLAAFYDLGPEQAAPLAAALGDPDLLEGIIGRGDFLEARGGLKCTEFNLGGNLGGWQSKLWAPRFLRVPLIRRFCSELGVRCGSRDTLRLFFRHVVGRWAGVASVASEGAGAATSRDGGAAVAGPRPAGAVLNLALPVAPEFQQAAAMEPFLDAELREVLADMAPGVRGRVRLCRAEQLRERDGLLWLGDDRVHAISEQYPMELDARLFACFENGGTRFFNGPLRLILDDKRNLALLSEHQQSALFSPEEQRLIAAHVPWTRRVQDGMETFRGEVLRLPELLLAERSQLVLKRAVSYGGVDVHLGSATSAADWDGLVRRATEEGGWVAQERIEMVPYVYQAGPFGCAPFDVVWGLFVFGGAYGGAFLRMLPRERAAVINTTGGAIEGIVLEVDE